MAKNFHSAVLRLSVFVALCLLGALGLVMVFGQLRIGGAENTYNAEFVNVSGLSGGNFVRIAGVEVGKVQHISVNSAGHALVAFAVDRAVQLTDTTRALIRYDNPIGGRYLELQKGAAVGKRLAPHATIPVDRTRPALDLDALIGGFRPLFRALSPAQVNALSTQLIQAFQGQGTTINALFTQTAAFTNTLADRDALIGQVVNNLNTVLASLGPQSDQLATAVDSLAELMSTLAGHKTAIANSLAYSNAAAANIADLLTRARPSLKDTVQQTDRAAGVAMADHDYLDNLLNTLPDAYQMLARQGLYGDFFSFYLCDLILKLPGKGGQPVYVKIAGQASGRCTPK
ncbi:Mce family protein Mce3B [Mycobacterium saskatchewanense]|uniref:Mammalian cell entry protein n=1 Tax=Mycobacterium saskatchewanense TaxID=220927 RepID=A0AAJ3TTJ2_9MYCO|nr:MCE family protein [Mycobacterium saskatchewanense]ORW68113.1 mammalian cell entry protein [Mycobacterium saskatchewanense]BBX66431.1 Mce family protein Mce3B [Mycobacterium saskatchewanense]